MIYPAIPWQGEVLNAWHDYITDHEARLEVLHMPQVPHGGKSMSTTLIMDFHRTVGGS